LSGLASIQGFPKLRSIIGRLPWVLQVCLREARNNEGLLNIHDRLLDGALGDFSSRTAIENEWTTNGVIFEELCGALGEHGLSIGPAINRAKGQLEPIDAIKVSKLLLSILSQEQDRNTRRLLSWTLAFVADRADVLAELPSHELSQHLLGEDNIWTSQSFRATSKLPAEVGSPWYDFFDKLGLDADLRFSSYIWKKSEINIDFYVNGYKADQSRIGLLRLLGFVCAAGVKVNEAASIPLNREHLSPQLLFSTLLIRLAYTNLTDAVVDSIIEDLPRAFSDNDDVKMHDVFLTALGYHSRDSAQTRRLLDAFETFVPLERLELKARIDRLRKRTVEVRPSGLGEKLLADLSLPSMAIPSSDE
jgi:hypothetical protein